MQHCKLVCLSLTDTFTLVWYLQPRPLEWVPDWAPMLTFLANIRLERKWLQATNTLTIQKLQHCKLMCLFMTAIFTLVWYLQPRPLEWVPDWVPMLTFLANIRLGWKWLQATNTLQIVLKLQHYKLVCLSLTDTFTLVWYLEPRPLEWVPDWAPMLTFLANIRLGWKWLQATNTLTNNTKIAAV